MKYFLAVKDKLTLPLTMNNTYFPVPRPINLSHFAAISVSWILGNLALFAKLVASAEQHVKAAELDNPLPAGTFPSTIQYIELGLTS